MTHGTHPPIQTTWNVKSFIDVTRALQVIINVVNRINKGKINCTRTFTLTENAATSTLTDNRLVFDSVVVLDPMTANAAAELAAGTMYALEATRNNESWVFTHANNAQTDRKFAVAIIG